MIDHCANCGFPLNKSASDPVATLPVVTEDEGAPKADEVPAASVAVGVND